MYKEGQTATNPKTGQRVVYKGGQWVNAGTAAPGVGGGRAPRLTPQEQIQLKEAREAAQMSQDFSRQANNFVDLNRKAGTGMIYKVPFVSEIASSFKPEVAQMDALTARMAPAQRVPGSGTTSDRDLGLYLKAVPNIDRPGPANEAIAQDMTATARERASRATFLDSFAQQNGTLMGAEQAYRARQGANAVGEAKPVKPMAVPKPARSAYEAGVSSGRFDTKAKIGTEARPYVARDMATANRLPKGTYVILPNGAMGVVE